MNRDHQRICPRCGTSPLADDVRCWNCDYPLELAGGATAAVAFVRVGDSTPPATEAEALVRGLEDVRAGRIVPLPPATSVETPDESWFQRQARLAARDVQLLPPWLRSHPPAVSGEGERLKKFREHLVNYQQGTKQRGTGAYSRGEIVGVQGTLAVLLGEFDQLFPEVRASTPTPGASR